MPTVVQFRRGTTTQNNNFTGADGEISVDTTELTLRVHNGSTVGGNPLATQTYVNDAISSLSSNSITDGTSNVKVYNNGNVATTVGGAANVFVVSSTGATVTGDLTVTGNATLSGNILGDRIQNGTTQIDIQTQNGNANISVGGTSNVAVFAPTGLYITGTSSTTGNVTGGNLNTSGQVVAAGNITGGNLSGASVVGTLLTASQPNITAVGTLGLLAVTGNIAGGNLNISGNIYDTGALSLITSASGNISLAPNGTNVIVAATAGAYITGTLNATGNISGGNLSVSTGTITAGNIVNANANGIGNIGSSTTYFNTVFAKATSAQHADLAEMYVADKKYEPGTVVEFGGEFEVTISSASHSTAVAGIVSTNPSYLMNSTQQGEHVLAIALTGRVPCCVQGPVKKGDVLVSSSTPGVAQRIGMNWQPGCVLGKSMEVIDTAEIRTIEVAVGRL